MRKELGAGAFADFVGDCLKLLEPEEFERAWAAAPKQIRNVVFKPPPDVILDVQKIKGREARIAMSDRLNELRRERVRQLASPASAQYYDDARFTVVPMSSQTVKHFWRCFELLPLPPF